MLRLELIFPFSAEQSLAVFVASRVLLGLWAASAGAVPGLVSACLDAAASPHAGGSGLAALPPWSLQAKEQIRVTGTFPTAPPASKVLFTGENSTRGKRDLLFKSVVIYRTRVSNIRKRHMWCWIQSLLPLPKNRTLSKWNFLLIWASLHSNSAVHLWCTGMRRYNLWTRQNELCPVLLSKGEIRFQCILGIYFYIFHICVVCLYNHFIQNYPTYIW